jgi:tetratricopeptide (TPR) repeat protein
MYERCENNTRGYNDKVKREASYYIADKFWRQGDFEKAIKYYKECSQLSISFDQEDDGFNVVSLLQLGKIYDILGKRDKAKYYYEEVLDLDDYNDSHKKAEKYLESQFIR